MVDYSKWEVLAKDEERREREEAEAVKARRHSAYLKSHQERVEKAQATSGHQHSPSVHSCGCSMRIPPTEQSPKDDMPLDKRNLLKIEAIKAAKTDGNRLFKEGDVDLCLQVYERGALICNGVYGLTDEQRNEVDQLELLLDLNIAQVHLRRGHWMEAISQCKMALQLHPNCVKAFYKMALAYEGMGEYDKAREMLESASKVASDDEQNEAIKTKREQIDNKARKQEHKARQTLKEMGARIAKA